MARRRRPYQEGDWFAVPLRSGGYALGRTARDSRKGILLGYFFGPRREAVPGPEAVEGLNPSDATERGIFGDAGLMSGEWPIVHRPPHWDRTVWPLPVFGAKDYARDNLGWRVEYDDELLDEVARTPISLEEAKQLPQDGLYGHVAVQIRLDRLLSDESQ